jgi:hypothetical protein
VYICVCVRARACVCACVCLGHSLRVLHTRRTTRANARKTCFSVGAAFAPQLGEHHTRVIPALDGMEWFTKIVHSVHNSVGVILEASRKGFDTHDCVNGGGGGGGGGGGENMGHIHSVLHQGHCGPTYATARTPIRSNRRASALVNTMLAAFESAYSPQASDVCDVAVGDADHRSGNPLNFGGGSMSCESVFR